MRYCWLVAHQTKHVKNHQTPKYCADLNRYKSTQWPMRDHLQLVRTSTAVATRCCMFSELGARQVGSASDEACLR